MLLDLADPPVALATAGLASLALGSLLLAAARAPRAAVGAAAHAAPRRAQRVGSGGGAVPGGRAPKAPVRPAAGPARARIVYLPDGTVQSEPIAPGGA